MSAGKFYAPLSALLFAAAVLLGCASTAELKTPPRGATQEGLASWYGAKFHGRPTASGEIYDMHRISAAHKQLPFGTVVEVRNKDNGRKLRVPINDRGPFIRGRIIDLSLAAARELGMFGAGVAQVRIRVVQSAPQTRKLPISHAAPGKPPRTRRAQTPPARRKGAAPVPSGQAASRSERGRFTIQAGAFREQTSAAKLARRLRRELGIDKVNVRKSGGVYRVQIERRRRRDADAVLDRLRAAGFDAFLAG